MLTGSGSCTGSARGWCAGLLRTPTTSWSGPWWRSWPLAVPSAEHSGSTTVSCVGRIEIDVASGQLRPAAATWLTAGFACRTIRPGWHPEPHQQEAARATALPLGSPQGRTNRIARAQWPGCQRFGQSNEPVAEPSMLQRSLAARDRTADPGVDHVGAGSRVGAPFLGQAIRN